MRAKRNIYLALGLFLAVPLVAVGAPAAQNQGGGPGGPGGYGAGRRGPMTPDDRLKMMTKEFNLTADEQTKIKPILVDEQKKVEDLRNNNSSGDRQAMRSQMMKIQQDSNTQIRALLDDNQKDQWDKQQQRMQDRMRRGPGGGQGGPGADGSSPNPPPQN